MTQIECGLRVPAEVRFWKYVNKNGPIHSALRSRCWLWTGSLTGGYPRLRSNSTANGKGHRYSWVLHNGEIPSNLSVLHRCDNPICVNPDHLFLGTQADNIHDMEQKGRGYHKWGEDNGRAILTEDTVRYIRERYKPNSRKDGQGAISRELGIHQTTVSRVLSGMYWSHVS